MFFDATVATAALSVALVLCAFAWVSAQRWAAILLPACVALACFCIYLPLGKPIPFLPKPGDYQVLGAKIVPNVGIWVLLDDGKGEPRYYRLPYSTQQANALQGAQDGEGGVKATVGTDGGVEYEGEAPVTGEPPKAPEQPSVTLP